MEFTLKVSFTGLCTFVENTKADSRAKMCVLLVDATPPEKKATKALDGTDLKRHRGFVRFPINSLYPQPDDGPGFADAKSFGIWNLEGERLHLEVQEKDPQLNKFQVKRFDFGGSHPDEPDPTDPDQRDSFTWVCDRSQVCPGLDVINARAFEADPGQGSSSFPFAILSQFIIDKGTVATGDFTGAIWDFDDTLSGKAYRRNFAHTVELTLTGLASAKLVSIPFGHPDQRTELNLYPQYGETVVRIQVANACDQNPLQWPPFPDPEPDEDSKWFFELLTDNAKAEVKKMISDKGELLPIPRPDLNAQPANEGPGSMNCIPDTASPTLFSFAGF